MGNLIKLPGLIDPHVHLREPGATHKEDFSTGTKAAIAGGYTLILDMPNNPEPTVTPQALENKLKLAKGKIYSDLGFHFAGTGQSIKYFDQIKSQAFGLKVYMNQTTGNLLVEDETKLEKIFSAWPKGYLIMVHAEEGKLKQAIRLAKEFNQRLHVCHLSTKGEILMVKKAKHDGLKISCEVTCHHLFLIDKDVKRLKSYGIMKPPLATIQDQQALWDNLDVIDMIASDHAPHTRGEKENVDKPPFGVPGLETSLPLLLTAFSKGKLSMAKLIDLTSVAARKIFKVPEQESTWVEVDPDKRHTVSDELLYTKAGWTPFAGMEVRGKITRVVLRGRTVFDGEKIVGRPSGQIIYPNV